MPCQTHYFSKGLHTNSLNVYLWKRHKKSQLHLRMTSYEHPFKCRFYTFSQRKTQSICMNLGACGLQEPAYVPLLHIFPKESPYFLFGFLLVSTKRNVFLSILKNCYQQEPEKKVGDSFGKMCKSFTGAGSCGLQAARTGPTPVGFRWENV